MCTKNYKQCRLTNHTHYREILAIISIVTLKDGEEGSSIHDVLSVYTLLGVANAVNHQAEFKVK